MRQAIPNECRKINITHSASEAEGDKHCQSVANYFHTLMTL